MKRIVKCLFIIFLFLFAIIAIDNNSVSGKSASSEVFEVVVGDEKLPVYYELVSSDNRTKEMLKFHVDLKGMEASGNSYRWEHTFCYKVEKGEEVCEVDLTGEDQPVEEGEEAVKVLSDTSYNYTYFDEDMPHYSESLEFEYIVFKNKFVCLDCGETKEVTLDDIHFTGNEINYAYNFDIIVDTFEKDDKQYVGYNNSALFVNNSSSILLLSGAPTYNIVNKICISETECAENKYVSFTVGNYSYPITPYIGNLRFPYNSSTKFNNIDASKITFKTILECTSNCDNNRRVEKSKVVFERTFDFYSKNPNIDINNSVVSSMSEYKKSASLKLTIEDDFSGMEEGTFYYYLAWRNSDGSCPTSVSSYYQYTYENGVSFTIGDGLNSGAMCMYFEGSSVIGNTYKSEYYILLFDNEEPMISNKHEYDKNTYYNQINLSPVVSDEHSGVKESYYLWTKEIINSSNYLRIKTEGNLYNGEISSLNDISEDGTYNLYFLIYDNAGNYVAYDLKYYNIDTIGLTIEEIQISDDLSDGYNNTGGITVSVSEMNSEESYKCGFLNKDNVTVSDLTLDCVNGSKVSLPSSLEGEYSFYAYVRDRANNYSLLKIEEGIKIDTKSPVVQYNVLYDDNEYRVDNEITINISDYSDLNTLSMKYGWFLVSKGNVVSTDLKESFENNGKIYYPVSYYGEYKLYISVMDNLGNQSFRALDKIFKIDTDIVRISLVGESEITILRGEKYSDLGAKAFKGEVGSSSRVSEISVSGEVDTNKAGVYYLTYSSGEGDFLVSVTRKVVVKNDVPYLLVGGVVFVIGLFVTSLRLFVRRKNA